MRDEVGDLIGLTYLVSIFPLKEWAALLTGFLHSSSKTKQYIVTTNFNGANRFPRPSLSRTYDLEAWKQNSKASLSNASKSQFLQNGLTVVPFKPEVNYHRIT